MLPLCFIRCVIFQMSSFHLLFVSNSTISLIDAAFEKHWIVTRFLYVFDLCLNYSRSFNERMFHVNTLDSVVFASHSYSIWGQIVNPVVEWMKWKKKMLHVIGTRAYDWKWAIRLNLKVEVNPLFDRINNWFFFSTCFAVWKKRLPGKTFRRQTIQTLVKCSDSSTIKCCIVHTMTRRSNRRR